MVAAIILFTAISAEASDDLLSKRPKRPSVISQKNLIEARDENGVHSIVPHHIYSNENSNLNSVGLSESAGPNDGTGLHADVGKVLQGHDRFSEHCLKPEVDVFERLCHGNCAKSHKGLLALTVRRSLSRRNEPSQETIW